MEVTAQILTPPQLTPPPRVPFKSLRRPFRNSGAVDGCTLHQTMPPHSGPTRYYCPIFPRRKQVRKVQVCSLSKATFFPLSQWEEKGAGRAASGPAKRYIPIPQPGPRPDSAQTPPTSLQLKVRLSGARGLGGASNQQRHRPWA